MKHQEEGRWLQAVRLWALAAVIFGIGVTAGALGFYYIAKSDYFSGAATVILVIVIVLLLVLFTIFIWVQSQNRKKLQVIAYVDPVTNGWNDRRFEKEARILLQQALPNEYAMVTLDIAKFKLINEAFGKEAGDRLLAYVHATIAQTLGEGEILARINADKFSLLLRLNFPEEVIIRIEAMELMINQFNENLTHKYFLTLSFGVLVLDNPSLDIPTMTNRADTARQESKKGNGIRHGAFYTEAYRQRLLREKDIENRMEDALQNDEFIVFLQPKYELDNQTICGAEALVRWQDPEQGLIPPMEFIPLFEKNDFIANVDLYVYETVLKTLRRWLDQGIRPVPVSVNLSRAYLGNPQFFGHYEMLREQYDIPPSLIEFEVTETLVFENMERLLDVLHEIHSYHYTCSLDDFGSGYSSLNILKNLPVDTIKLDRFFFLTKTPEDEARGKAIVEAVLSMAHKLNLKTVAEGVDNDRQVVFLKQAGCNSIQGYVFSKPLPIPDFEKLAYK